MPINKQNADNIRRQLCALSATEHGHASQKLFDLCNRLFGKPTYPLDFTKQRKWQEERKAYFAKKKPQQDPHEACLNAKDYEGCVRVKSGASASTAKKAQDSCIGEFCKVTTRGVDILVYQSQWGGITAMAMKVFFIGACREESLTKARKLAT